MIDQSDFWLDPVDAFDAALIEMAQLHRKKRADYAADSNRWSNFETTASLLGMAGFGTQEAIEVNIAQKMARLQSLRLNGRMDDPQNESVLDTRRDLAVYSVLSLVHAQEPAPVGEPTA